MANVTVIGAQWGDEGKGKLVDWLSNRADVVVRFQGGHNAGHTLVVGNQVYKLSLLPSGRGAGQAVDHRQRRRRRPLAPAQRDRDLRGQGVEITPDSCWLADNACLILPIHRDLDQAREAAATNKIGTTGRGIGPAYEDKVGRRAIRVADLADREALQGQDRPPAGPPRAAAPGPGAAAVRRRRPACGAGGHGAEGAALCAAGRGCCWTSRSRPAAASCSRARKGRCSTSITAPIPT
jgi:hypothetical protein